MVSAWFFFFLIIFWRVTFALKNIGCFYLYGASEALKLDTSLWLEAEGASKNGIVFGSC